MAPTNRKPCHPPRPRRTAFSCMVLEEIRLIHLLLYTFA